MPYVTTSDGVRLYYEARGEGVPVLGIHGTPSSALMWVERFGVPATASDQVHFLLWILDHLPGDRPDAERWLLRWGHTPPPAGERHR